MCEGKSPADSEQTPWWHLCLSLWRGQVLLLSTMWVPGVHKCPSSERTASSCIRQKCLPTCEQNPHGTATTDQSEWLAEGSNEVLGWGVEAARCLTGGGGLKTTKTNCPRIPWHTKSRVRVWGLESQKTSHCISLPEQWVTDNIQDTHR